MNMEWRPEVDTSPFGPFVGKNFKNESITHTDVAITSVVWALTLVNIVIAGWLGYKQCHSSRSPLRSVYIWMIWIEMAASFIMGLVCFLFVLKYVRPSKMSHSSHHSHL
jgi:TRAP-type C4-dicarboxylate transport system permease small subunit